MNSTLSKGVPLDFDRTTLFIGFFGCYCALNRSMLDVDRCCWSISGWAVGAIAGGASGSIGRFVWTILLMAWTIVVLQHFLNSWLGGEWLGFMGWGLFFLFWVGCCRGRGLRWLHRGWCGGSHQPSRRRVAANL
jgi:hypothetical protein